MNNQYINKFSMLMAAMLVTAFITPAQAIEEAKTPYADALLGDWNGMRTKMNNAGLDIALNYKGDFWDANSGGAKHGTAYVGAATLGINVDNEKLLGIKGNSASLQLMNTHGGHPNSYVGSLQGVDNYEVATPNTFVYEAWVQQNFWNDRLSFLVGLKDLNVEFIETDISANFLMPTMQIGQDVAQTGLNGPSIYPVTGLSARARINPTKNSYLQAAVFDGVPGDLNHPHGTHINLDNKDGELLIAEAGLTPWNKEGDAVMNKFAIGYWAYTKQFPDFIQTDGSGNPILNKSQGLYALSSVQFYKDKKDRTAGAFLRIGATNGDVSVTRWAYEAGLVGRGWIPTRSESEIGLGVSQAHIADRYIQATGGDILHDETSYELYYRDHVARGVTLQPDIQYIRSPGITGSVNDATTVALRMNIDF